MGIKELQEEAASLERAVSRARLANSPTVQQLKAELKAVKRKIKEEKRRG